MISSDACRQVCSSKFEKINQLIDSFVFFILEVFVGVDWSRLRWMWVFLVTFTIVVYWPLFGFCPPFVLY